MRCIAVDLVNNQATIRRMRCRYPALSAASWRSVASGRKVRRLYSTSQYQADDIMTFRKGVSGNPAGRPRGSKNRYALDKRVRELAQTGESPLEVMLAVMRDPNEKIELRLDAAKAAAPYMHAKLKAIEVGGKEGEPIDYKVVLTFD